jgi:hypothetical protein
MQKTVPDGRGMAPLSGARENEIVASVESKENPDEA